MDPTAGVSLWQPGQPKLLDRVRDRCRVRHLSLNTQHAYEAWIRRYVLFRDKRHPLQMGATEVAAFLTHLAVDRHDAASTQNQALSALLFLPRSVAARIWLAHAFAQSPLFLSRKVGLP